MKKLYVPDFTNRFNDKRLEKRGFSWFTYLPAQLIAASEELVHPDQFKKLYTGS